MYKLGNSRDPFVHACDYVDVRWREGPYWVDGGGAVAILHFVLV